MLPSTLRRTQGELQWHRRWLNLFVANHGQAQTQTGSHAGSPRFVAKRRPYHNAAQSRTYATIKRAKTSSKPVGKWRPSEDNDEGLLELQRAALNLDINTVAKTFDALREEKGRIFSSTTFREMAVCLHNALRRESRVPRGQRRRETTEELLALAEKLVVGVKTGQIKVNTYANLRLLSLFKESDATDAGVRFWEWLRVQDDLHVSVDVYGAAIELLAVNGTSLPELEELYIEALQRFPGNFSAYHLSHNAIVPDRDHSTVVRGISNFLLRGIITARLLRGDARNAYLGLDTALRLFPVVTPPRLFALFMEERPIAEAYSVFAVACRAGVVIPLPQVRRLLTALRTSSDLVSPTAHILAMRRMLSVVYMHIGAAGTITSNLVNEVVIAMTQTLRLKGMYQLEAEQKKKVGDEVLVMIRKTLAIMVRYGAKPGLSAFNAIITNIAGFGEAKSVIGIALKDAQTLGLAPDAVTLRSILTAAGISGDGKLVVNTWKTLEKLKQDNGERPDMTDLHILIKAARLSESTQFAEETLEALKVHLTEDQQSSALEHLHEPSDIHPDLQEVEAVNVPALIQEMEKLRSDLELMEERAQSRSKALDFSSQALPMMLSPPSDEPSLPESELRMLYEQLSTDQQAPASQGAPETQESLAASVDDVAAEDQLEASAAEPQPGIAVAKEGVEISPTGIPFGTLRYENWKSINALLAMADHHDTAFTQAVDRAIAAGVAPPSRADVFRRAHDAIVNHGLSDAASRRVVGPETAVTDEAQVRRARARILRLRGLLPDVDDGVAPAG